jgi:hypothetical protein
MTLEREKHALEHQTVLVRIGAVSSEVDLDAPVRQPQQLVRADQDVHRAGKRGQRLSVPI